MIYFIKKEKIWFSLFLVEDFIHISILKFPNCGSLDGGMTTAIVCLVPGEVIV